MANPNNEISSFRGQSAQANPHYQVPPTRATTENGRLPPLVEEGNRIKAFHESILNEMFPRYYELFPRYGTTPPLFLHQFINIDPYTLNHKIPETIVIAALQVSSLMQYCSALRSIKAHPTIPQIALDVREGREASIIPIITNNGLSYPLHIAFHPLESLKTLVAHLECSPMDIDPLATLIHSFIPHISIDNLWYPQRENTTFAKHKDQLKFDTHEFSAIALDLINNPNLQLSKIGLILFSLSRCTHDNSLNLKPEEWKIIFHNLPKLASACKTQQEKASFLKMIENGFGDTCPESLFLQRLRKAMQENTDISEDIVEEIIFASLADMKIPQYSTLLLSLARKYIRYPHQFFSDVCLHQKVLEALLDSDPKQALALFDHLQKCSPLPETIGFDFIIRIGIAYRKTPFTIPYFSDIHRIGRHMQSLIPTKSLTSSDQIGDLLLWIVENTLIEDDAKTISDSINLLDKAINSKIVKGNVDSVRESCLIVVEAMVRSSHFDPLVAANRLINMHADLQSVPHLLEVRLRNLCVKLIEELYNEDNFECDDLAEKLFIKLIRQDKSSKDLVKPIVKKQLQACIKAQEDESYSTVLSYLSEGQSSPSVLPVMPIEKITRFVEVADTNQEKVYCIQALMQNLAALRAMKGSPEKIRLLKGFAKIVGRPEFASLLAGQSKACEMWLQLADAAKDLELKYSLPQYYAAMDMALQAYAALEKPSTALTKKVALAFDILGRLENRPSPNLPSVFRKTLGNVFPMLALNLNNQGLFDESLRVHDILLNFRDVQNIIFGKPEFLTNVLIKEIFAVSDEISLNRMHGLLTKVSKAINFRNLSPELFQVFLNFAYRMGDMKAFDKCLEWFEALECTSQYPQYRVAVETYLLGLTQHIQQRSVTLKIFQFCIKKKSQSQDKLRTAGEQLVSIMLKHNEYEAAADFLINNKELFIGTSSQTPMISLARELSRSLVEHQLPMQAARILNIYSAADPQLYLQILKEAERSTDSRTRAKSVHEFLQASKFMVDDESNKMELAACWSIVVGMIIQTKESSLIGLLEPTCPLQILLADPALVEYSNVINMKVLEGASSFALSKRKDPPLESYLKNLLSLRRHIYPHLTNVQCFMLRATVDPSLLLVWRRFPDNEILSDICNILIENMEANTIDDFSGDVVTALRQSTKCSEITNSLRVTLLRMAKLSHDRCMNPNIRIDCIEALLHSIHPATLHKGAELFLETLQSIPSPQIPPLQKNAQVQIGKIFGHLVKHQNPNISEILDEISLAITMCKSIEGRQIAIPQTVLSRRKLLALNESNPPTSSKIYFETIRELLRFFPLPGNLRKLSSTILCDVIASLIPIMDEEGFHAEIYEIDKILSDNIAPLLSNVDLPSEMANKLRHDYLIYVNSLLLEQKLIGSDNNIVYQAIQTHLVKILQCNVPSASARALVEDFIFSVVPINISIKHDPHPDLEDIPGTHIKASSDLLEKAILAGIYANNGINLHKLYLYLLTNFNKAFELTNEIQGKVLKQLIEQLSKMNNLSYCHYAVRIMRNNQIGMAKTNEQDIFSSYNYLLNTAKMNAVKKPIPDFRLYYFLFKELSCIAGEMIGQKNQLTNRLCNMLVLSVHQVGKDNITSENPHLLDQANLMKTLVAFLFEIFQSDVFKGVEGDKGFLLLIDRILPTLMSYDVVMKSLDITCLIPYLLLLNLRGLQNKFDPKEDPRRLEFLRIWVRHLNNISGTPLDDEERLLQNIISTATLCLKGFTENDENLAKDKMNSLLALLEGFAAGSNPQETTYDLEIDSDNESTSGTDNDENPKTLPKDG